MFRYFHKLSNLIYIGIVYPCLTKVWTRTFGSKQGAQLRTSKKSFPKSGYKNLPLEKIQSFKFWVFTILKVFHIPINSVTSCGLAIVPVKALIVTFNITQAYVIGSFPSHNDQYLVISVFHLFSSPPLKWHCSNAFILETIQRLAKNNQQ